jgi:hypothetical protein
MAHHAPVSVETSHDPLTRMRAYQLVADLIRRDILEEMRRLLLAIIPRERGRSMK